MSDTPGTEDKQSMERLIQDVWDVFILPSEIDTDQGDCDACGTPFTFDEWDLRHTNKSGEVHAECCHGCRNHRRRP